MNRSIYGFILFVVTSCMSMGAVVNDDFLWLEEVESSRALEWVKEHNEQSLTELEGDARYAPFFETALGLLTAEDRIPFGEMQGGFIYNFWQDQEHVRGLWRRAKLSEYKKEEPTWEVLLDLDELAEKEDENWVFSGADCLAPDYSRCLIHLSRGGKDAAVVREFDLEKQEFIEDGFYLPEAKSSAAWLDQDTLLVGTEWSSDSLTDSGYPRILKIWKRGTPLEVAETVFSGEKSDIASYGFTVFQPERSDHFIARGVSFFESEVYWLNPHSTQLQQVPIPEFASLSGLYKDQLVFKLRKDWELPSGEIHPAGALLAFSLTDWLKTNELPKVHALTLPESSTTIQQVSVSASGVWVSFLDNVQGRLKRLSKTQEGVWKEDFVDVPDNMAVQILGTNAFESDILYSQENFTTPNSLFLIDGESLHQELLKSEPQRFEGSDLVVKQEWATSADGTQVPYFLVHKRGLVKNGQTPALLYGYGGFEVSVTPRYAEVRGKLWLERGGALAIANIRGGGEFGPRWHQAALKENRQRAFDDFIAVAEHLIQDGITSSDHLGILGGSNGGLLVGATFTQRPDLMKAVLCLVPLLDMLRFHKLLAGASWVAEYGNPEDPEMREVLKSYSPYHQVRAEKEYPEVFFITSTKDDRVHPGHARRMAAKMEAQGHPFYYYENIEGGHGAAANLRQSAKMNALQYIYLSRQLGLE